MTYTRRNRGVCSVSTEVSLSANGVIEQINVVGGCNGNLSGLCTLLEGMTAQTAIEKLQGLTCGAKKTSCPDQIAQALQEALAQ